MPSVNPGPSVTQTPSTEAVMAPVNTANNPVEIGANLYRLLGVVKGVRLSAVGDTAIIPIINATAWAPALIVTANGKVSGVQASIATAAIGVFTAAAAGGSAIKANAALTNNSAAGSSIALATTIANLAFTTQQLYINVGTALANATVDLYLYGYDQSNG